MKTKSKFYKKNEFYIACLIFLLAFFIEMRSGLFFTSNNILDILRAMIVPGMLGLAEYIVMISGGCDVSFPYVAALSMYSTIINIEGRQFYGKCYSSLFDFLCVWNGSGIDKWVHYYEI